MNIVAKLDDLVTRSSPVIMERPNQVDSGKVRMTTDPSRMKLIPLEEMEDESGKYTFFQPYDSTVYDNDAELRRSVLKARSVLAAAFLRGDLSAKCVKHAGHNLLLVGQSATLLSALGDFTSASAADRLVTNVDIKGILPILSTYGGWRAQPGWMVIFSPEVRDSKLFYQYIRTSILWFSDRPRSLSACIEQRMIEDKPNRSLQDIFAEALKKQKGPQQNKDTDRA